LFEGPGEMLNAIREEFPPDFTQADLDFMENLSYGASTQTGQRSRNEDTHTIIKRLDHLASHLTPHQPVRWGWLSFFGVYDGHGGVQTSEYCRDNLHVNIAKTLHKAPDLLEAMKIGTVHTETAVVAQAKLDRDESGAVAVYAIVSGKQLYISNLGDCRAVLCRDGQAQDLTTDHKPTRVEEVARIEADGGFVEFGMLNGDLAVSRALGDVYDGEKMKGLSSIPDFTKFYMTDDDEFVILACDGLWDVLTSQKAVSYARRSLQQHGDPQRTSDEIVSEALRMGSEDNVTVIVIAFRSLITSGATRPRSRSIVAPASTTSASSSASSITAQDEYLPEVVPPRRERPRFCFSLLQAALAPSPATSPTAAEAHPNAFVLQASPKHQSPPPIQAQGQGQGQHDRCAHHVYVSPMASYDSDSKSPRILLSPSSISVSSSGSDTTPKHKSSSHSSGSGSRALPAHGIARMPNQGDGAPFTIPIPSPSSDKKSNSTNVNANGLNKSFLP